MWYIDSTVYLWLWIFYENCPAMIMKEMQCTTKIKLCHICLGNNSEFWKTSIDLFYKYYCCLLWLRKNLSMRHGKHPRFFNGSILLKLQMRSWISRHFCKDPRIFYKWTSSDGKKKTPKICIGTKRRDMILHLAICRHEWNKISMKYKIVKNVQIK